MASEKVPVDKGAVDQGGQSNGSSFASRVTFKVAGEKRTDGGAITSVDYDSTSPPCWYEPYWTAKQFKSVNESQWSVAEAAAKIAGAEAPGNREMEDRYKNGEPYKNFNVGKQGRGMWWIGVANPEMKDDPRARSCNKPAFWVDNGKAPNEPQAIDTGTLAQLAYDQTRFPSADVTMNPDGRQTVNLPTWIWLGRGTFKETKVRAELPGTGLWAETTARPVGLHLDPGTDEAQTHPASGECKINDDGSIGTPYRRGEAHTFPPCGITYLRATQGDPYPMHAAVTWVISWEGADAAHGHLPDGTSKTTRGVVNEIHVINR
ncbi:hypothetical protein [Streptomyces sp. NPDC051776]|uniref:hypothetical protein n=1 Tax=Streptomyces sp. NPDC051776 TaxID=3155414 RepID=UPI003443E023